MFRFIVNIYLSSHRMIPVLYISTHQYTTLKKEDKLTCVSFKIGYLLRDALVCCIEKNNPAIWGIPQASVNRRET